MHFQMDPGLVLVDKSDVSGLYWSQIEHCIVFFFNSKHKTYISSIQNGKINLSGNRKPCLVKQLKSCCIYSYKKVLCSLI